MPTNFFVPMATGSGANVRTDANWSGSAVQVTGVQTGIVASADMNKAWRQSTSMASVLGQLIVNRAKIDAADNGNIPGLLANVEQGIAAMIDPSRYAEDGGAVNALVASLSPAPVALSPFVSVRIRVAYANTSTTPTLNLNGFGPLTVVRQDGSALAVGDLQPNRIVNFIYDRVANTWRIGGPAASDLLGATYITVPTTKTVGGTNPDFANLTAAFAWLSNYRIALTGSVTFQLAAMQFVTTASIYFQHPDGARVTIQGATLKASPPAGSSLTISGNSPAARSSDTATNLAALRNVFATEIYLTSGAQFTGTGTLGNLQDILFTSDGSGSGDGIFWPAGRIAFTRVGNVGSAARGVCAYASYISISGNCYSLGCASHGMTSEGGGVISILNGGTIIGCSNGGDGVLANAASIQAPVTGGAAGTGTTYTRGNAVDGVGAANNGSVILPGTALSNTNAGAGYRADNSASISAIGSVAGGNANGYFANQGSTIDATNTSGANATYGYLATNGSNIVRTGGTATGGTANASPTVGSVGNSNAFIA
jgi:hypothetical protein